MLLVMAPRDSSGLIFFLDKLDGTTETAFINIFRAAEAGRWSCFGNET